MRLREGQNDRLRVARCNTSCEARFTAGRNGNGPRRTAGVQNRGNFSPHPTKDPGARESGNHPPAAAHQQLRHDHSFPTRTISYAYTWQAICGMPISVVRWRTPITCTPVILPAPHWAAVFFSLFPFSFHSHPCRQGSRVELPSAVC